MELICEKLKEFLVAALPQYLEQMEDAQTPLPALTEKTVKVGGVRLESERASQLCYIVPDTQTIEELTMASEEINTRVDAFIFVRNKNNECLFRQALRYGLAIKKAIQNDYTCNGAFSNASVVDMEYFEDVEATDGHIQAVRIGINIITEMMEE